MYRAYLNYLESELMMMKYADDIKLLRKYYIQGRDDMTCISSIKIMNSEIIKRLVKRISNTSLRKQANKKVEKNWNEMSIPYTMIDLEKRHLKCR